MSPIGALIISITLLSHQIDNYKLTLEIPQVTQEVSIERQIDGNNAILEAIAKCESNNIPTAKNPKSSASGRFQFIKGSWEYYGKQLWGDDWKNKDIFDYHDNTELAEYVYSIDGTRPWSASSHCWSKDVLARR